jgi:hypothetical protein
VQSRQAASASQVIDTRERTSEDGEDSRLRATCRSGVSTLNDDFRSAGPMWRRARLPTINAVHIGTQWLIPLPSTDSADATKMRTGRVK